ncbi:MAG: pitrilysin family protein [Bacteroidota bacterium]|nr:pitrilysin family protein [Bacteroidota bacterium]MDP4233154.1 pitrilysin family protein [Bacteroidota bacterium]MDP4241701.1 pitrilysin family protein [Bacteroidota bacterium]MDP4287359.1 pitrilysin family protein [Bacteroidota bacterium]
MREHTFRRWGAGALLTATLLLPLAAHAQDLPYSKKTLSNGLDVIVVQNHMVPLATIELVARNGGFTEPPEYSGLSHLYEHMFFKANKTHPSQAAFLEGLESLGGSLGVSNAQTHQEHVNYFIVIPKKNLSGGLDFMSAAIRTPLFDTAEIRKERYVVLGEFDRNEAEPTFKLRYAMDSAVWSPALFSRKEQLGLRPTILSATPEMMRTIEHRFYIPNNMALVVAGDVNPEEVFKQAEKYFGPKLWPAGPPPFPTYNPPPFPPITKQLVVREAPNLPYTYINFVWHGPSLGKDNEDTYAADVFHTIINQANSRFQKDLVDKRLAYQVQSGYFSQKNVGPIEINAYVPIPATKKAISAIEDEIAAWNGQTYFTDDELTTAKRILEGDRLYETESASEFATSSLPLWWASAGLDYYVHYIENVKRVTRADIQRYLDRWIKGKNYVLGVATNQTSLDKLNLKAEEVLR